MGYPGKVKFPIISNYFAKCDHKGELSAVFSAIYYLKMTWMTAMSIVVHFIFSGAVQKCCAEFGQGVGQIWLYGIRCDGSEDRLEDCARDRAEWGGGNSACSHGEDVGVVCQAP